MSKRLNMSNDEAVEWLLSLKNLDICGENRKTAIDKAVTALEAQPCEDCISREAVNVLVDELARAISDEKCCISRGRSTATIMRDILHLSSVTPQRPKGKWIKIQSGDKDFPESIVCSRCKNENSHLDFDEHSEPIGKVFVTSKYCQNCGAEMSGGEEDEEA